MYWTSINSLWEQMGFSTVELRKALQPCPIWWIVLWSFNATKWISRNESSYLHCKCMNIYTNTIIICVYIMYTWLFWSMLQYHPISHLSKIPSKMGRSAGCNLTSTPCRVNVSPQHRPGQTHRSRRCGSWAQTWLGALGYRRRYTVV